MTTQTQETETKKEHTMHLIHDAKLTLTLDNGTTKALTLLKEKDGSIFQAGTVDGVSNVQYGATRKEALTALCNHLNWHGTITEVTLTCAAK